MATLLPHRWRLALVLYGKYMLSKHLRVFALKRIKCTSNTKKTVGHEYYFLAKLFSTQHKKNLQNNGSHLNIPTYSNNLKKVFSLFKDALLWEP